MTDYQTFLAKKTLRAQDHGLKHIPTLAAHLFPFQKTCVEFALRAGSAGNFLSTGLGKTACELEWAAHAADATNGRALILAPLSVGWQIAKEGERWGYDIKVIRDMSEIGWGINVCNYDRLDKLDPAAFGAVALDESSILKSFNGKTSQALIQAFSNHRFRLSATATPAPNDHMELGQQSDFLGIMPSSEMLMRWFINDTSTASQEWRLKKHAVNDFWDWCASWSRMAELPSDLGGDDTGFILPPMKIIRHHAEPSPIKGSDLFGMVDMSATSMHDVKRKTAGNRANMAFEVVMGEKWHGRKNTQQPVAPSINPTKARESDEKNKQEAQKKTSNICDHTTNETPLSLQENALMKPVLNDGINTQAIQTNSKNPEPPQNCGLGKTRKRETTKGSERSVSQQKIMPLCSPNKTETVPFAVPSAHLDVGLPLITATPQELSGDFSAALAISELANLEMTQVDLGKPLSTLKDMDWWVIWCDTDYEQDELEDLFGDLAISIKGSMTADRKEYLHSQWVNGERKILITKSSIFGRGMNWQHCCKTVFVGRSFSYEDWYQAVRRFWRFGQLREVEVHLIVAEGEQAIARVIDRKSNDHIAMKQAMRAAMARANGTAANRHTPYLPTQKAKVPTWLS